MSTPKLPKYCYARGERIWVRYRDAEGKWVNKRTPYSLDQVEYARRFISARLKAIAAKVAAGTSSPNSVREYVERWFRERESRGIASAASEYARLKKFALPHVGDLLLEDVRPHHVRDLVRALKKLTLEKDKDGNRVLAPRTVHHVFSALYNVFENAIVDELVFGENPVKVKAGELPKKVDSDPEWRSQATYAVAEVEGLLTETIIPVQRRVQYALKALAGLRHGEVAGLAWRHFDVSAEPLRRINVVQSWCSVEGEIKSTKTEETRQVPAHPVLAKILTEWREKHWPRIYGRAPTLDDFVVPTRTGSCVSAKDANEAFKRDLAALKFRVDAGKSRDRGGHDLRSWYQTRCIEDGADSMLLRRTTHAAPKTVSGGYERFSWATLCREVAKLTINVPDEKILQTVTLSLQAEKKAAARWTSVVTPLGLEPFSERYRGLRVTLTRPDVPNPRSVVVTREHSRVTAPVPMVSTAVRIAEKAIRNGDLPRALQILAQLEAAHNNR